MYRYEAIENLRDNLSDGQWHSTTKILRGHTRHFSSADDLMSIIEDMKSNGELIVGANNSYRMPRSVLESWRIMRGLGMKASASNMGAPRFFGDILEDDGWVLAPLRTMDVVHFHANFDDAAQARALVGLYGMTLYNFEGLVRIYALDGSFAYKKVCDAKDDGTLDVSSIRIDSQVKRRELCDLPSDFVSDMCDFYGAFAHALLRQSMSSVRKHIIERDDIQQQIYLWIIDAIQRYDAETSIPFAAYLHSAINRWVHDLSRKQFGRAVADSELQISRAQTVFQTKHNRPPTVEELAGELNEDVNKVRRKMSTVKSVSNIRDATTIIQDDYELTVVSSESSTGRIEDETNQTLLSVALTTSAIEHPNGPNVVAWCGIYSRYWGGESTSRRTTAAEREVMESMRSKLVDA